MRIMQNEKGKMILAMLLVGTIGIVVSYIPLPSSVIACVRSILGTLFLAAVMLVKRSPLSWERIKPNALFLLLSGAALGFNWIFLFEAYRYTTVAVATLCYYMAPVFVMLLSPLVLNEQLTPLKKACTCAAVCGAVLISGALGSGRHDFRGIGFGLSAAVLYCSIIFLNKKIHGLENLEKTLCQLAVSAVTMSIYVLCTQNLRTLQFSARTIFLLLVIGFVYTGIEYIWFFSAIGSLPAQTSSILSYIDPVTAILSSALLLHQPLTILQIFGTILILGSMILNELLSERKKTI